MLKTRAIPCLLLKNKGLVKTVRFKAPVYIGDPINAVRIFNEKEVDELVLLDITATAENKEPDYNMIYNIASEAFMPIGYGGGIRTIEQAKKIFNLGIEKIIINNIAVENPSFINEAAKIFGNQSVVVSIDVKKNLFGKYEIFVVNGKKNSKRNPVEFAIEAERQGAGELFVNSIDRDGTMTGYDLDLIKRITAKVGIPVIASGGAGKTAHFREAVLTGGASAVAAGSMFVFHGPHKAVLITYPTLKELYEAFS